MQMVCSILNYGKEEKDVAAWAPVEKTKIWQKPWRWLDAEAVSVRYPSVSFWQNLHMHEGSSHNVQVKKMWETEMQLEMRVEYRNVFEYDR